MSTIINATTTNGVVIQPDNSGSLVLQTNSGTTALTIDTSQRAAFVAGTAALPAITTTGDTNTGMWFPAADTIAFAEGGTESMRIDSSGNVGINTTSPSVRFQVSDGAASSNATMKIHNVANANTNFGCAIQFSNQDPTYYMGQIATLRTNSAVNYSSYMTFSYSANTTITEGMRLTSDGELWVARTTDAGAYNIQCGGTGVWGAGAYVNGSDSRIKDNIEPISSSLEVVSKLNPVTYKYKEDWSKDRSIQTGFIAQELLEALEGQNYVDGVVQQGGVDGYYSVAYQNIIPILTKAIQEQQTIINDLKARIETLEAK